MRRLRLNMCVSVCKASEKRKRRERKKKERKKERNKETKKGKKGKKERKERKERQKTCRKTKQFFLKNSPQVRSALSAVGEALELLNHASLELVVDAAVGALAVARILRGKKKKGGGFEERRRREK